MFPIIREQKYPCVDHEIGSRKNTRRVELGAPLALIGKREHPEARRFAALAEEITSLVDPVEEQDEEVRQLL